MYKIARFIDVVLERKRSNCTPGESSHIIQWQICRLFRRPFYSRLANDGGNTVYGELVDGYMSRSGVRVRYNVNIDRSRLEAPTCLTKYSPPRVRPPLSIAILVATTILIPLRADRERIITPPSG